jgi:hypothetical protein
MPFHIPSGYQAIDEFDRAVVLDLQTLRDFANRGPRPLRQPLQAQHELVLSWLQARGTGRLFTEREEAAYLITQLR